MLKLRGVDQTKAFDVETQERVQSDLAGTKRNRLSSAPLAMLLPKRLFGLNQTTPATVCALVIYLLTCGTPPPAHAYRFDAGVGIETGYTDNVNLTQNKEADIPVEVFTTFRYAEGSSRTLALIEGRLGYRDYLKDNAADQLRPDVYANMLWRIDPERWSWVLDGRLRLVRRSELGPDSPENTETQGFISTGPDFRRQLSAVTTFRANARAGYLTNSDTGDDNARFGGELSIDFEQSETATISGNLEARAVRYLESNSDIDADVELSDFNIAEAFIGYSRQDGHVNTLINIGPSFVNVKDGPDEVDLFLQVDASREFSAGRSAGLTLFFGFDDEGTTATARSPVPEVESQRSARVPNVFYEGRGEVYYARTGRRYDFQGRVYGRKRDFEDDIRDEIKFGGGLTWTRRLTRLTEGSLLANVDVTNFDNASIDQQEYRLGLQIRRQFTRKVFGAARLQHRRQTSNNETLEYDESAVYVFLEYQTGR